MTPSRDKMRLTVRRESLFISVDGFLLSVTPNFRGNVCYDIVGARFYFPIRVLQYIDESVISIILFDVAPCNVLGHSFMAFGDDSSFCFKHIPSIFTHCLLPEFF